MSRGPGRTIFIGLLLASFTVPVAYLTVRMLARSAQVRRAEREGVTEQAIIVRRYTRSGFDSSRRYYIDVKELRSPSGALRPRIWQQSKEVSGRFYESVSEGQTITIRRTSFGYIIPGDAGPDPPAFVALVFIIPLMFFWAVFIRQCVQKAVSGRREPDRPRQTRGPTHSTPDD